MMVVLKLYRLLSVVFILVLLFFVGVLTYELFFPDDYGFLIELNGPIILISLIIITNTAFFNLKTTRAVKGMARNKTLETTNELDSEDDVQPHRFKLDKASAIFNIVIGAFLIVLYSIALLMLCTSYELNDVDRELLFPVLVNLVLISYGILKIYYSVVLFKFLK